MSDYFSEEIKKYIFLSKKTQSEIVDELQKFDFKLFHGLDVNTLNRWVNRRTNPCLQKKISLFILLNLDLLELIRYENLRVSKREMLFCEDFFARLDRYQSHSRRVECSCTDVNIDVVLRDDYRIKYPTIFYSNSAARRLAEASVGVVSNYDVNIISLPNSKESHVAYVLGIENAMLDIFELDSQFRDHLFIFPLFYHSSDELKSIICRFMSVIISKKIIQSHKNALITLNNAHLRSFFEAMFDAKLVKYYPRSKESDLADTGVFLYEFSLVGLLSSPYFFNALKRCI